MSRTLIPLLAGAVALSGCAAIPNLGPAPKPMASASLASAQSFTVPQADWPADSWWTAYGDAQLNQLMDEALKASPTLAQASARLRAADAAADQARGATLPSLSLSGYAAETKQSYNAGFPKAFVPKGYKDTGQVKLDAGFDLDIWGRNRAALAAATSEAQAAKADAAQARLILTTSLAAAYADFARLSAEHEAADAAARNRSATADLVAQKLAHGAANRGEADQARAAAAAARQDLAALDEELAVARNRLAALTGAGPDRGLALTRPVINATAQTGLPANLGADLVGRRPDLASARLRAEAAARRIDVARAGFYPNLNLAAYTGVNALGLDMLTKPGSDIGQLGLAFSLPIFEGGRIRAGYRGARAEYDAAVAAYDQTLVQALQEVADAAAGERALQTRLTAAREALEAGEASYKVARLRYEGGLSTYITLLSAEDAVIAQRRAVAQLEARALTLDASLVRALGGGFRA